MERFLIFQLYGPMQSYGGVAVGEVRPGYQHPGKSALLGLIASCLGIRRDENEKLEQIHQSYCFAVRVDNEGVQLRDFHTVQSPKSQSDRWFYSRREEVLTKIGKDEELYTVVSFRDYAQDALFGVCLWICSKKPPYSLEEIKEAMSKPAFIPYLGRKSCPAALPFKPTIITSKSIASALNHLLPEKDFIKDGIDLMKKKVSLYWEQGPEPGTEIIQYLPTRDQPLNRLSWQFGKRMEYQGSVDLPDDTG